MIKIQQPFREMPLAVNKSKMSYLYLLFVVMKNVLKEMLIKNFSALLKEPLFMFGSLETVLSGSWQSIKGAKIALF